MEGKPVTKFGVAEKKRRQKRNNIVGYRFRDRNGQPSSHVFTGERKGLQPALAWAIACVGMGGMSGRDYVGFYAIRRSGEDELLITLTANKGHRGFELAGPRAEEFKEMFAAWGWV